MTTECTPYKHIKTLIFTAGIVLYCLLYIQVHTAMACNPSDFVLDEFSARCKNLAERIRDTEMAYRMGFPDAGSRSAAMLDDWLSFFLDHGVVPPPVYASLAGPGWEEGMRSLGRAIGAVGRGEKVSGELLEMCTVPLEMLAAPSRLQSYRAALASITQRMEVFDKSVKIESAETASCEVKLPSNDRELAGGMVTLGECLQDAPNLNRRLNTLYTSLTSIDMAGPEGGTPQANSAVPEIIDLQLNILRSEMRILDSLGFWQAPMLVSQTAQPQQR